MKFNFKSRKGFTLIELLVVIGILAVTVYLVELLHNIWRYVSKKKEFKELEREDPDTVAPDKVNYQLYLSSESSSICFLLNIHTGEIWRYLKNSGERSFQKMKMPWDNK